MAILTPRRTHIGAWHLTQFSRQAGAVLREARPGVQLIFLARIVAASGVFARPSLLGIIGIAGWQSLALTIYVFNGVTDEGGDVANGSTRPIAGGMLAPRTALRWCFGLAVIGLLCLSVAQPVTFVLGSVFLTLGWAYSAGPALKRSPAGFAIVIAAGAALTYAAGSELGHSFDGRLVVPWIVVSVWVGLCCASKDFSDIDGDRQAGRHTWPVMFGARRAAWLLAGLAIAGSIIGVSTVDVEHFSIAPSLVLLAGSVLLAASTVRSAAAAGRSTRRRPYRVFVLTQYLANVALACVIA